MVSNMSTNWIESDRFYVEQSSKEPNLPRTNTLIILNSTEMSGNETREMISIASFASPEPQIVTIDFDSKEPTMPFGFERQLLFIPPSLNDLKLPPNPVNIQATTAVVNPTQDGLDENYSPPSPEPPELSPISIHPWIRVHLTVGKHRIPIRTTTFSFRRTSQDECTGPVPWMKLSIGKANPDESTCCAVHPRRHHLPSWRGS